MDETLKQKFYNIYMQKIIPVLKDFELKRKSRFNFHRAEIFSSLLSLFLSFIPGVVLFLSYHYNKFWLFSPILYILFFIISIPFIASFAVGLHKKILEYKKEARNYKNEVKEICVPIITDCISNLHWKGANIPLEYIKESNIFPEYSEITIDDCFCGEYKGVSYNIQETKMVNTIMEDRFGNKHQINVFNGVIIVIPTNKSIKTNTIVYPKSDFMHVRNFPVGSILFSLFMLVAVIIRCSKTIALMLQLLKIGLSVFLIFVIIYMIFYIIKMKKINLEDVNFSKKYYVSSADEIEARYLVTPAFMERFDNLQKAFGTNKIKCSFFNDKIMFAISAKSDLFEFSLLNMPIKTSANNMDKLYREFTSIFKMIDYLKFNERTGL